MAETFLYFTELLNLPVYDLKHRRIGRVRDAALVPLVHQSRVDRFLVGAGSSWFSVRYDQISAIGLDGIELSDEKLFPYHSDEYMLRMGRDLLDQQIIDVNGRKVVRVNDVTLEVQRGSGFDQLYVFEVDIGVRSIVRRLLQGAVPRKLIRALQKPIGSNSIRWDFCNIVEADPQRRLRLNISHDKLELMHPADLADIVEELGPAEREAIFETIDSEVAADALSEMDSKTQASILESLEPEVAADIVEEMSPDEAADALGELEEETSQEILEEMEQDDKTEVTRTARIRGGHRRRSDEHRVRQSARVRHRHGRYGHAAGKRRTARKSEPHPAGGCGGPVDWRGPSGAPVLGRGKHHPQKSSRRIP